jgi:hypothetical protein
MREDLPVALGFLGGAALLFAYTRWRWSGRNREWLRSYRHSGAVLGLLPALSFFMAALAIATLDRDSVLGQAVLVAGLLALALGHVIYLFEPSWWGPGWLRDLRAAGVDVHTDPYGTRDEEGEVVFTSTSRWPSRHSEAVRKQWDAGVEPIEEWQVTEVQDVDGSGVRGLLQRYKPGLLFITDGPVEMMNQPPARLAETIGFREVKEVDLLYNVRLDRNGNGPARSFDYETPLLSIGKADGHGWRLFKLLRPTSVAERIAEFAGCQVREFR